jgi:ABC-type transporter Mla subunit MlaD
MSDPSGNIIIEAARVELTDYQSSVLASLNQYNAVSKQQVEFIRDDLSGDILSQAETLSGDVNTLETDLQNLLLNVENALEAEINELSGQVFELSGTVVADLSALSGSIESLSGDVKANYDDLEAKIAELSGLTDALDQDVDAKLSTLSGFAKLRIDQVVNNADSALDTLKEIETYLKSLSGEMKETLEQQQTDVSNDIASLNQTKNTLSGEIDRDFFRKQGGQVWGNTTFRVTDNSKDSHLTVDFSGNKVNMPSNTVIDATKFETDRLDFDDYFYLGDDLKWRINPDPEGQFIAFEYSEQNFTDPAEIKRTKFKIL